MTKIGLEIHCQLTNLQSKLFCSCKANYREFEINENICPICMGLPGSLPRLNQEAVKKATIIAMALNCTIPEKIDDPVSLFLIDINTVTANLTGKPAISVPFAFSNGLPIGIQLLADSMHDKLLLRAAHALEQTVKLPEISI